MLQREREREREIESLKYVEMERREKGDFIKKGRTKLLGPEACLLKLDWGGWEKKKKECEETGEMFSEAGESLLCCDS